MGNPDTKNPRPKPQDHKKQSGTDPMEKRPNPDQQGQGRDPMKDPDRQRGGQADQRKQGQGTRKPA